jgi:RNA recognition motif-containing protein
VVSVELQTHKDTGRSKGWALVRFKTADKASFACQALNLKELQDRQVTVRLDRLGGLSGRGQGSGGHTVYIGNLAWTCTDSDLASEFREYNPSECRIMRTATGKSRGFGIVQFTCAEDATSAIRSKNGTTFLHRVLIVRHEGQQQEVATNTRMEMSEYNENRPRVPCETLYVNNLSFNR